jgi:ElaB/YqjD/DUF883 family membrane-anchored ribosome-binding protein
MVAHARSFYPERSSNEWRSTTKAIMTTQSTTYPEVHVRHARKASTDGLSAMERIEAAVPELPGLKAKMRRMVKSGTTRVTQWRGGIQDGIRERPIQTVLIAAAVGAVLGLIVGRRSR